MMNNITDMSMEELHMLLVLSHDARAAENIHELGYKDGVAQECDFMSDALREYGLVRYNEQTGEDEFVYNVDAVSLHGFIARMYHHAKLMHYDAMRDMDSSSTDMQYDKPHLARLFHIMDATDDSDITNVPMR